MIPSRWRYLNTGARTGSLNMALDDLAALIEAARAEASRRLKDYRDLLK